MKEKDASCLPLSDLKKMYPIKQNRDFPEGLITRFTMKISGYITNEAPICIDNSDENEFIQE